MYMPRLIAKQIQRKRMSRISNLDVPTNLMFFVTNRCNMRCPHCFYWKDMKEKKNQLSLENIQRIADSLDGLKGIGITGGEPTIRDDITDICKIFMEKGGFVTLITNGLLTDKITDALEKLSRFGRINVHISVDGTKEVHEKIRGKDSFSRTFSTIQNIRSMKNVKVILVTTITKSNISNLEDLVRFFSKYELEHRFNIARGSSQSLFNLRKDVVNYHEPQDTKIMLSLEETKDVFSRLKKLNVLTKHEQLVMEYVIKIIEEKKKLLPCFAGKTDGVIYPNGDVAFCEFMKPFGNLRAYDFNFRKLWSSEKSKVYRKLILNCFCTHTCNISTSLNYDIDSIRKTYDWRLKKE